MGHREQIWEMINIYSNIRRKESTVNAWALPGG